MMLYKLEIIDHQRRLQRDKERLGPAVSVNGIPIPVVLSKEDAVEVFSLDINILFFFGLWFVRFLDNIMCDSLDW